jgi:hypothetical protein
MQREKPSRLWDLLLKESIGRVVHEESRKADKVLPFMFLEGVSRSWV